MLGFDKRPQTVSGGGMCGRINNPANIKTVCRRLGGNLSFQAVGRGQA
jgi:hypothetical protein